jgi:hypothetical protein
MPARLARNSSRFCQATPPGQTICPTDMRRPDKLTVQCGVAARPAHINSSPQRVKTCSCWLRLDHSLMQRMAASTNRDGCRRHKLYDADLHRRYSTRTTSPSPRMREKRGLVPRPSLLLAALPKQDGERNRVLGAVRALRAPAARETELRGHQDKQGPGPRPGADAGRNRAATRVGCRLAPIRRMRDRRRRELSRPPRRGLSHRRVARPVRRQTARPRESLLLPHRRSVAARKSSRRTPLMGFQLLTGVRATRAFIGAIGF